MSFLRCSFRFLLGKTFFRYIIFPVVLIVTISLRWLWFFRILSFFFVKVPLDYLHTYHHYHFMRLHSLYHDLSLSLCKVVFRLLFSFQLQHPLIHVLLVLLKYSPQFHHSTSLKKHLLHCLKVQFIICIFFEVFCTIASRNVFQFRAAYGLFGLFDSNSTNGTILGW